MFRTHRHHSSSASHSQLTRTPTYSYAAAPPEHHAAPPVHPYFPYNAASLPKPSGDEWSRNFDGMHTQPTNTQNFPFPPSHMGRTVPMPQPLRDTTGYSDHSAGYPLYVPAPPPSIFQIPELHSPSSSTSSSISPDPSPILPFVPTFDRDDHHVIVGGHEDSDLYSDLPSPPLPGPLRHSFSSHPHNHGTPFVPTGTPGMKFNGKSKQTAMGNPPELSNRPQFPFASTQSHKMPLPSFSNTGPTMTGASFASGFALHPNPHMANNPTGHWAPPHPALSINSLISASTKPFPLLMDLRRGAHRVWMTSGCKPGSIPPEMDDVDRHSLATTPMLREMRIISPDHNDTLVVKNPTGVTIDDVITSICEHAAAAVSPERWNTFSREHQQAIMKAYHANRRGPFAQYLLDEEDDRPLMVDTFVNLVCWGGLKVDPVLVNQRFGHHDGKTFVSTLTKGWISWLDPEEAQARSHHSY